MSTDLNKESSTLNITDPVPNGALAFKSFLFVIRQILHTQQLLIWITWEKSRSIFREYPFKWDFIWWFWGCFFFALLNYSCCRIFFNIEFIWSTVARVIPSLFYLSYKTFPLLKSNSIVKLPLSWLSTSWAVQFPEFSSLLVTCCSLLSACRELEIWSPCSLLTCCRCSRSNLSLSDDLSRSCLLKDIC